MKRHAQILVGAGYDVTLVGRLRKDSRPLAKEVFEQKRLRLIFEKGKLFYAELNFRLLIFLLFVKADVFVAVDYDTLLPVTLMGIARQKKRVFDAHEYFTEVPELQGRFVSKNIWEFLGAACVPLAHAAYTVGPTLAGLFSQQHGIRFEPILNAPALTHDEPQDNFEARIILYQGALNQGRGLENLILAMKQLDAVLWIAGEGDLSLALRNLADEYHLNEKVKFLGWVRPDELRQITASASIGVNLLDPVGLSYRYSLANKFFDYFHMGIPQICANFEEYQHVNSRFEVAILCENRMDVLLEALNKLLNNRNLYSQMQINCARAAQVYNLQAETEKLKLIYYSL